MSDPVGIPYVFSTVFLLEPCFPQADHVLPSLMMQPEPSQTLPCALGPYRVTSRPVATVAVPPLSGRVTGSALQRKWTNHVVHPHD